MRYVADTHTHTIASGHAYTTLLENINEASKIGLEIMAVTDHGPSMPGAPNYVYFANLKVLPRIIDGITILRGCEANVIDIDGNIDLPEYVQQRLDIIIASLHDLCIKPGNKDENTKALINVMKNPFVDIIGHAGNPDFPIWEEEVVKEAKKQNKIIEINNGSFLSRKGSLEKCTKIACLCKEYGVNIVLGSDAHTCFQIGKFPYADEMLTAVEMPEKLILSTDAKKLLAYLKNKGKVMDINLD